MATSVFSLCKPCYTAEITYMLDRNLLEDDTKQINLKPFLEYKASSDVSWKVILELGEKFDGSELCSTVQIWYLQKKHGDIPIATQTTVTVRVRQECDEAVDAVSAYNAPWQTHLSGKFVKVNEDALKIVPSMKKMHMYIRITWRGEKYTSTEVLGEKEGALCTEVPKNLVARLLALSSSKTGDVVFLLEEEEIVAHTPILASVSEVFKKMFEVETQDKLTRRVKVEDASPKGFRDMLRSLYTGQEPDWEDTSSVDYVLELAYLAHKYGLELLLAQCACRMVVLIQVDNVCKLLKAAVILDFQNVVDRGIRCIKENREVLQSNEWNQLAQDDPHIVIKLFTKML